MGCGHNISRMKSSSERKPIKKKEILLATELEYQARCRNELQKHHEDLKDDPDRLTTDFLVKICKCKCQQDDDMFRIPRQTCPECGSEVDELPPQSAMGERMSGRGIDYVQCTNPRCRFFGIKR